MKVQPLVIVVHMKLKYCPGHPISSNYNDLHCVSKLKIQKFKDPNSLTITDSL